MTGFSALVGIGMARARQEGRLAGGVRLYRLLLSGASTLAIVIGVIWAAGYSL